MENTNNEHQELTAIDQIKEFRKKLNNHLNFPQHYVDYLLTKDIDSIIELLSHQATMGAVIKVRKEDSIPIAIVPLFPGELFNVNNLDYDYKKEQIIVALPKMVKSIKID